MGKKKSFIDPKFIGNIATALTIAAGTGIGYLINGGSGAWAGAGVGLLASPFVGTFVECVVGDALIKQEEREIIR